jgi:hypothetical protein
MRSLQRQAMIASLLSCFPLFVHAVPHIDKLRENSSGFPRGVTHAAPAGSHLTYYGGRVVSNIKVVQVIWGSGSYLPQITSTTAPGVSSFFRNVLVSAHLDWLREYDTTSIISPSGVSSRQSIGRGSFVGQYTITPSVAANGTTISDVNLQAELARQIQAGHLPAPERDAGGNPVTYYAVFFPAGKSITLGSQSSCVSSGFCAYHGAVTGNFGEAFYGAHPDMQPGSGCNTGCGASSSVFNNQTSVASHELVEAITDPEVSLATAYAPPLAWYDATNGEIGDICNAEQGTITGGDGAVYTVQAEFSNALSRCIIAPPAVASNDAPAPLWALVALAAVLMRTATRGLHVPASVAARGDRPS